MGLAIKTRKKCTAEQKLEHKHITEWVRTIINFFIMSLAVQLDGWWRRWRVLLNLDPLDLGVGCVRVLPVVELLEQLYRLLGPVTARHVGLVLGIWTRIVNNTQQ